MDEGLIQFLFFLAIFVLFPLMEGAAKKKKRERQRMEQERAAQAEGTREAYEEYEPTSSESMLPEELWEELQELARGGAPEPALPEMPAPETRAPEPIVVTEPEPSWHTDVDLEAAILAAERAERPSSLRKSRAPLDTRRATRPAAKKRTSVDGSIRAQLHGAGTGRDALRRAILYAEILAPPKSERPDPFERGF